MKKVRQGKGKTADFVSSAYEGGWVINNEVSAQIRRVARVEDVGADGLLRPLCRIYGCIWGQLLKA